MWLFEAATSVLAFTSALACGTEPPRCPERLRSDLSDVSHRRPALWRLQECRPTPGWAVEEVTRVLITDKHDATREDAAQTLGHIGKADDEAIQALLCASGGESDRVSTAAAWALSRIGRPAVPALRSALRAGGWVGEDRPVPYVNAVSALGRMGEDVVPDLIDALKTGNDDEAAGAASALWSMGSPPAAAPALVNCLGRVNSHARRAAAQALAGMEPVAQAVPGLVSVLQDDWWVARWQAAETLERMGCVAAPALPNLERAAQDEFDSVARAARAAVDKIRKACQPPE